MTPDMINGSFELVGAMFLFLNCRRMYIDKEIKGLSIWPVIFFTSWGYWNIYYYPTLGQWYSFFGGLAVVLMNTIWLIMTIYYIRNQRELCPTQLYQDQSQLKLYEPDSGNELSRE